jgi:hypothetical protein
MRLATHRKGQYNLIDSLWVSHDFSPGVQLFCSTEGASRYNTEGRELQLHKAPYLIYKPHGTQMARTCNSTRCHIQYTDVAPPQTAVTCNSMKRHV